MLHRVQIVDNVWIPVDESTRLSAKLWLPQPLSSDDDATTKFSVVLEYIPYRKSDWTAPRDNRNHTWMAQRGFAVARVDIRGSGNSDGYDTGEYTKEELDDGVKVIAWLAEQPWCTGNVGIFGKSWGGFNGFQLGAMAPPALKSIISLYSIDDRYADDVHYMGGTVLGSEALSWATVMLEWNARPPAPEAIGSEEEWKAFWKDRLEHHHPWLHDWLAHQSRDAFWKHGSVCEDYSAIKCPVLAIGGWADGYFNGIFRMLAAMDKCVVKGVIGPWSHEWPHIATPGPQVGFLEMCRQWWDYSLNGVQNAAAEFPDVQLFVKDAIENPSPQILEYPGKWVGVQHAQDLHQAYVTLACTPDHMLVDQKDTTSQPDQELVIHPQSLQGAWSGEWLSFGGEDMPGNQASEDGLAATWSTAPLDSPIEIAGFPEVSLLLKSSRPQALVMARLCDVAPSGKSTLIARGVLNLSHRHGHGDDALELMAVGGEYASVTWKLNACAYSVAAGHKILLAITPNYWPMVWPSPEPTDLTLSFSEANTLKLPVLPGQTARASACPVETYPHDEGTSTRTITLREAKPMERKVSLLLSETDPTQRHQQQLVITEDEGKRLLIDEGIIMEETGVKICSTDPNCLHPHVRIQRTLEYEKLDRGNHQRMLQEYAAQVAAVTREDEQVERVDQAPHPVLPWKVKVYTDSSMSSNADTFFLKDRLVVHLNDEVFHEKEWEKEIPRYFV